MATTSVSPPQITILGLGPGDPHLLTRQAWQILNEISEIYLRTRQHPTVDGFPTHLTVHAFDHLYEAEESFEAVYREIVSRILDLGHRPQGVVYAVPGDPYTAEATTPEIVRRANAHNLSVRIVTGISYLEPSFAALGIDPLPHTALVDALEIAHAHHPPFPPDAPALIAQIYSPRVASNVKLTLMTLYPDQHPVRLVHGAGTSSQMVEDLPLYQIDRSPHIGLLTSLYVPPLGPGTSFEAFQEIIAHLRAPDGCPWDKEQDHQSLRPNLLEETYEVLSALDDDDPDAMREEFGDLLLQIVLHAQIGSEYGEFTMAEVIQGIYNKISSRHPHVFGDLELDEAGEVILNWERLKATERRENGAQQKGVLDGVPLALPSLTQAFTYQKRAARVGFDWPEITGVLEKIAEEMAEVETAHDQESRQAELGDLLFAVVNLTRWYDVDPESALREANLRFKERFSYIEKKARAQERELSSYSLEELEAFWQEAKGLELGTGNQGYPTSNL